ncbi:MAG: tetratricopeptide repeat protein [Candidatus Heimdallarchaeota archaeon]
MSHIEKLIQKGAFDSALHEVERLEKTVDLEQIGLLQCVILRSRIHTAKGEAEKGLQLAQDASIESEKTENPLIVIDVLISKATALLTLGRLDSCLEILQNGESLLPTIQDREEFLADRKAILKYIAGKAYRRKGDLERAHEFFQDCLSIREASGSVTESADPLNDIGIIYAIKGEFNPALDYLERSLAIFETLGNKQSIVKLRNNIGRIYEQIGELDQALENLELSLELSEELGNKQLTAALLLNIGLIALYKGELDSALDFYEQSFAIFEELENKSQMADCLNNIGVVYTTKGELEKVLEIYQRSLELRKELGDNQGIATSLNNIGHVYKIQEDFETALAYFEDSLELFDAIGNDVNTCQALYNLIVVTIRARKMEKSNLLLERLEKMSTKKEHKLISQLYRLAKALILATNPRLKDKARAQGLLQEIAEEDIVNHDYTMEAMLQLTELLLFELKVFGEPPILHEISTLTRRLVDIAQDQNNFFLLAETYMLQSKTALLELDVKSAQQLLNQAQMLAEEKGLPKLAMRISGEYDSLLGQMKKWDDYVDRDASLSERLELARLEDMVIRMIRKREDDIPERPPEEPVMMLIIGKNGLTLFSHSFQSKSQVHDQLMGGFLTAVQNVATEILAGTETLDRIMYQEHTIALKAHGPLMFCYIFKGASYSALKKLDQCMETVNTSPNVWEWLIRLARTGILRVAQEQRTLEGMVDKIFLASPASA